MNRRNLLHSIAGLIALPFSAFATNKLVGKTSLSPLAQEIEKFLLQSCDKPFYVNGQDNGFYLNPNKIDGVWNDPMLHRQRRVGCYWIWTNAQDGQDYGCAFDMLISDVKSRFGFDKPFSAWEDAVNEVHNKYTGSNRTEHSQITKYMDA